MRSLPALVAVGLVVIGSFAAAVVSSPIGFLGETRGGENQSTEDLAPSDPTTDSGGGTVIANVPVGLYPFGVAYDSGNGYVYVANQNSNTVSVINGTTVVATVAVGSNPGAVAYDSGNGYVYVANLGSNDVSVISGTTVVATIPVGIGPHGVAYDSENGYVYVTNSFSSDESVISTIAPLFLVTFSERGLPSGSSWSVTVEGLSNSFTTPTITFSQPNGTHSFAV